MRIVQHKTKSHGTAQHDPVHIESHSIIICITKQYLVALHCGLLKDVREVAYTACIGACELAGGVPCVQDRFLPAYVSGLNDHDFLLRLLRGRCLAVALLFSLEFRKIVTSTVIVVKPYMCKIRGSAKL